MREHRRLEGFVFDYRNLTPFERLARRARGGQNNPMTPTMTTVGKLTAYLSNRVEVCLHSIAQAEEYHDDPTEVRARAAMSELESIATPFLLAMVIDLLSGRRGCVDAFSVGKPEGA